ncbi:MAG: amidase [Chloroflexi bacterium]|nr:amidase [Chloroflexota bacterium]
MDAESLPWLPLEQLAPLLESGEVSPVALTEATLARIQRLDSALNAFITITNDTARREAETAATEIAAGHYRGPLHGVPVSVKDLFATRGVRTTAGAKILSDWTPDYDAAAVERLRAAGAVLVGKNTLHEFALGGTSLNPHFGNVLNPWDRERVPGGSSGGSAAAVAAGLSTISLGSETGNSTRRPAAFCGIIGLKPTYGRISRFGAVPAAWSLDHVGIFARSVRGVAATLDALSGPDRRDRGSASAKPPVGPLTGVVKGLRAGVPEAYLADLTDEVGANWEAALAVLAGLGVRVRTLALPTVRWTALVSSTIMQAEASTWHRRWLAERPADYGADVRERLQLGLALSNGDYLTAQRGRQAIADEVAGALAEVDLLIAPTVPAPAPPIAGGPTVAGDRPYGTAPAFFHLHRLFSLLGLPVVSTPSGFSAGGLPLAIQIAGRPFAERTVLETAAGFEAATGWAVRRPPVD